MNRIKFKDHINLEDVLKNFKNNNESYDLDSPFDEFISVNKTSRIIMRYGYNGLVNEWYNAELLEWDTVRN